MSHLHSPALAPGASVRQVQVLRARMGEAISSLAEELYRGDFPIKRRLLPEGRDPAEGSRGNDM